MRKVPPHELKTLRPIRVGASGARRKCQRRVKSQTGDPSKTTTSCEARHAAEPRRRQSTMLRGSHSRCNAARARTKISSRNDKSSLPCGGSLRSSVQKGRLRRDASARGLTHPKSATPTHTQTSNRTKHVGEPVPRRLATPRARKLRPKRAKSVTHPLRNERARCALRNAAPTRQGRTRNDPLRSPPQHRHITRQGNEAPTRNNAGHATSARAAHNRATPHGAQSAPPNTAQSPARR